MNLEFPYKYKDIGKVKNKFDLDASDNAMFLYLGSTDQSEQIEFSYKTIGATSLQSLVQITLFTACAIMLLLS